MISTEKAAWWPRGERRGLRFYIAFSHKRIIREAFGLTLPLHHRDDMIKLGTTKGGWFVPGSLIKQSWRCYCFGVGDDVSFDLQLIQRYGCDVFAFDPTPRAIDYIRRNQLESTKFHFSPMGLWDEEADLEFFEPTNPAHVSYSCVNLQKTDAHVSAHCKTLVQLMDGLGHDTIDLLKMDIEGAECAVLQDLVRRRIRPQVICVEFHPPSAPVFDTWRTIRQLLHHGYDLCKLDKWNYTFVKSA